MAAEPETMSGVLRRAVRSSGLALLALERETGVKRASIARFLRGERSLRLDRADALAAFLGLELRPRQKG
jgi:transcriptional regulator with XRE-family HTH domain